MSSRRKRNPKFIFFLDLSKGIQLINFEEAPYTKRRIRNRKKLILESFNDFYNSLSKSEQNKIYLSQNNLSFDIQQKIAEVHNSFLDITKKESEKKNLSTPHEPIQSSYSECPTQADELELINFLSE